MQCPHCLKSIHTERQVRDENGNNFDAVPIGTATIDYIKHEGHQYWWIEIIVCPSCHDLILTLVSSANTIVDHYVLLGGLTKSPSKEYPCGPGIPGDHLFLQRYRTNSNAITRRLALSSQTAQMPVLP